jgi:hypothetical protein
VKSIGRYVQSAGIVSVLLSFALIFATLAPPAALVQAASQPAEKVSKRSGDGAKSNAREEDNDKDDKINPPPFDFTDAFYNANGINVQELNTEAAGRFGLFRKTGPPAGPNQLNWVIDNSNTDPNRNNVRILASTGGYKDDTGSPTQFISIIAFLTNQNFFTGVANARGLQTKDIVGNFEAYVGLKQVGRDGVFRPTPCASIGDQVEVAKGNCFRVDSVATPSLRQDWRFSTNRSAIDGSGPLSYFGDDLLGMWIITYFWYSAAGFGPQQTPDCKSALNFIAGRNGLSLDGTPLIKTGAELHFLENNLQGLESRDFPSPPATACALEGNLDAGGADHGPVWLVCPSIPDPTQGGIAPDAFVDTVHNLDGSPLDPQIAASFNCLQKTGQFCRLASGTYRVLNQSSGLFWDGSAPSGGTAVQLAALNTAGTGNSQQWTFTLNSDGTYRITNKASGLALTDPRGSKASGTRLVQSKSDGDSDEKWIVAPLNNGYRISNVFSRLAVDATSDAPPPGTSIIQATPTGESGQVWVIR